VKTQNSKIKNQKCNTFAILLAILTFNFFLFTFSMQYIFAADSSNNNYSIQDINTSPNKSSAPGTNNIRTVQPGNQIEQGGQTESVAGGVESLGEASPLSFSLSDTLIDFGVLSASNPVTRTAVISAPKSLIGYQVQAFEDHSLLGANNQSIADTTCDNGACSEEDSALWANNLTYGFGFRCDSVLNEACIEPFAQNYYRQFADLSKQETPQAIIVAGPNSNEKKAEINFKVDASGNQKPASYSNSVTFIAVPNY